MVFTMYQMAFLLIIYSVAGWIVETTVVSLLRHKFVNRGFLKGPNCLSYGISAVIIGIAMNDAADHTGFLFAGCAVIATTVQWFTGKMLQRVKCQRWWDYSDKKFNIDGYICLQYTVLWGILGIISVKWANGILLRLFSSVPQAVREILIWIASGILVFDIIMSLSATAYGKFKNREFAKIYKKQHGIYKLFILFVLASFIGDIVETIFCRINAKVWMSRSSLVWGPFSLVWGIAIVLVTLLLHKERDKSDAHIFVIGTVSGGVYEYVCSVFTEIVFGKVFWDYSRIPFNIGGRINLLFCFFWGIAAVVWIKVVYPRVEQFIESIPVRAGIIAAVVLAVFMTCNITVSVMALVRYDERANGIAARAGWQSVIDERFTDERMRRIYPNAISR